MCVCNARLHSTNQQTDYFSNGSPSKLINVGNALPGIFPVDAHVAFWHSGSLSRGYLCPLHQLGRLDPWPTLADYTNSVAWTHGLLWPTTSVPGVPSTQYAYLHSHAPSRSRLLHPSKGFVPSSNTNNKPTSVLVNLTNPLTLH